MKKILSLPLVKEMAGKDKKNIVQNSTPKDCIIETAMKPNQMYFGGEIKKDADMYIARVDASDFRESWINTFDKHERAEMQRNHIGSSCPFMEEFYRYDKKQQAIFVLDLLENNYLKKFGSITVKKDMATFKFKNPIFVYFMQPEGKTYGHWEYVPKTDIPLPNEHSRGGFFKELTFKLTDIENDGDNFIVLGQMVDFK